MLTIECEDKVLEEALKFKIQNPDCSRAELVVGIGKKMDLFLDEVRIALLHVDPHDLLMCSSSK